MPELLINGERSMTGQLVSEWHFPLFPGPASCRSGNSAAGVQIGG